MADYKSINNGEDAESIQGIPVTTNPPTDGQALVYNAASGAIVYGTVASSGGGGGGSGDSNATYIVVSSTGSLGNNRALAAGLGLTKTDGGAGGSFTLAINNNVVATVSGSTFAQLTGSLQKTSGGLSYLVGGTNVTVSSASNGQVTVDCPTFAPVSAFYLVTALNSTLTGERVLTPGTGLLGVDGGSNNPFTLNINNNVLATVSGSRFTGNVVAAAGLSGSLQQTSAGLSYLVSTSPGSLSIVSQSNGQIFLSSSGGAGGGSQDLSPYALLAGATFTGPVTASAGISSSLLQMGGGTPSGIGLIRVPYVADSTYCIIGTKASNAVDRYIIRAGSDAISFGDPTGGSIYDGASLSLRVGGNSNLEFDGNTITSTGKPFVGSAGFSGSHTRLTDGTSYLIAGSNVTITSQSNGSVLIGSTASGGGVGFVTGSWFENALNQFVTTGSISVDSQKRSASTIGTDVVFFVSGSQNIPLGGVGRKVSVFGGDLVVSGSTVFASASGSPRGNVAVGTDAFHFVSGTVGLLPGNSQRKVAVFSGDTVFSGSAFFASGSSAIPVLTPADVYFYVSGSTTLTGSAVNPARKVTVFGGDLVHSGAVQRQIVTQGQLEWNYLTTSLTTNATPFCALSWLAPSGSSSVTVTANVVQANCSNAGQISKMALFTNMTGTLAQVGNRGGISAGLNIPVGYGTDISIEPGLGTEIKVWLTGSAARGTQTWLTRINVSEIKP